MKKVWIFFLGLMMLAAITVGAVACNKGEEETGTRVVLYDFEQSILPVGMFQDFGALDINEDAEYVHGGALAGATPRLRRGNRCFDVFSF